jgi:electron transfer flavoprotein alpha subunit
VSLAGDYEHIVACRRPTGKNVMPRVAAKLDVMDLRCTGVVDADTFERPIYAGNAFRPSSPRTRKRSSPSATRSFDAAGNGGSASVETVDAGRQPRPFKSEFVSKTMVKSDRPELTSAGVVVSGGRGLGSEDDFAS